MDSVKSLSIIIGVPVLSMIVGMISPSNDIYGNIIKKVRPPGYVFGIAWSILYTLIGLSWAFNLEETENKDELWFWILYPLMLLVLYSWSWVFNKNPKLSLYVILISYLLLFMIYSVSNYKARVSLSPLIIWLFFATLMNYTIALKK